MAYDLQATVTAWVAQELELQAPGENLGYWVTIMNPESALPRLAILVAAGETWHMQRAYWPPSPAGIRQAVRKALEEIARVYTGQGRPGASLAGPSSG